MLYEVITTTTTRSGTSVCTARCGGSRSTMISYHALLVTLGVLLGIVILTTFAAIVNKLYASYNFV